ncbi:hypothetical protein AMTRI_Chr12g275140 [Amborella trichopoda]
MTTLPEQGTTPTPHCVFLFESLCRLMAKEELVSRPWVIGWVPFLVVALIVAHLLAFAYWIYRVATERQSHRRKTH